MHEALRFQRRVEPDSTALDALFQAAWGSTRPGYERVFAHSFTWVTATDGDRLVGFVNVAWDGDVHFFLLDTTVHPDWQRRGIGRRLVAEAVDACRGRGDWLHVDSDAETMKFYAKCGFEPTPAGLIRVAG